MTTRHLRVIALLVIAALANAARADHPNIARGFDVGKPYQMNGIDNINLFNGNLTVTLPIGQRYHVNGGLGYGLTLVYSGNVWDTVDVDSIVCNGHPRWVTRTYPNRRSNAGLGWLLSLGRLFPRNQYPTQDSPYWQYETPDGGLHTFRQGLHDDPIPPVDDPVISYTRDGTYLRMTVGTSDRTVEFPDGTAQVFKELDNTVSPWQPLANTGRWRLTEIHDRFNNVVSIEYTSTADNPEIWTIRDGTRTQTVYFVDPRPQHSGTPYDVVLDKVVLSVFNSAAAEWKPAYTWSTIAPGATNQGCSGFSDPWSNVPLLTSLTLPAVNNVQQVYSMVDPNGLPEYYLNTNAFNVDPFNGHLRGLQLPTRGWLEWDYINFIFYAGSEDRMSRSIAVSARRMVAANRTTTATWTYRRQSSGNLSCLDFSDPGNPVRVYERPEQLVVSVTSPEQVTSVHYFSTYQLTVYQCVITSSFIQDEYGLPFTRGVSQAGSNGPLYLSEEIYSTAPTSLGTLNGVNLGYRVVGGTRVRSEWVSYSYDPLFDGATYDLNARESAHATYFEDDAHCNGTQTCYSSLTRYGFDGAGHFRQSSTAGNFPSDTSGHGNFKTTFANYPNFVPAGNWLFNRYTERCVADETGERTTEIGQCSSLGAGALISQSCFDATTGFLKRTRALSGLGPLASDVLAVYTPQSGNVSQEDYYGGDTQTLPDQGTDLCTVTLPASPQYSIASTYLYGSLASSRYLATPTHPADPSFYNVNNTLIDSNTGLVRISADPAVLTTSYDYDILGRVTHVAPPGEAAIDYTYTEATASTPPQATVTKVSAAAGTIQATTIFDDFGRVSKEQRFLPAGIASRETDYTGSGWMQQVSEWESTPSHFTVFSNFDSFGAPV